MTDANVSAPRCAGTWSGERRPYNHSHLKNTAIAQSLSKAQRFRLLLCSHKVVEVGGSCLLLMVQGQLAQVTAGHFLVASETGALAVFPLLGLSLTSHARHFANRWTSSAFVAICAFFADAVVHGSHYPGAYTEAALTAVGTFVMSVVVSYTPVGRQLDRLAEGFMHR